MSVQDSQSVHGQMMQWQQSGEIARFTNFLPLFIQVLSLNLALKIFQEEAVC
jgi:hypothetical protein